MAPSFADIACIVKAFTRACRAWKLGDDEPDVLLRVVLVVEGGEGGHVLQGVGGQGVSTGGLDEDYFCFD